MEEKFKMNFLFQELLVILKGLKKLPYEESAGLIASINNQYETELIAKEAAEKAIKNEGKPAVKKTTNSK